MKRRTVCILLFAVVAGCGVSKQVVEEKETAISLCQAELATCQSNLETASRETSRLQRDLDAIATTQAELDTCVNDRARIGADLGKVRQELATCREAAERDSDVLSDREARLRERLQQELEERTVELEHLKGKLAVRVLDRVLFDSGNADILAQGKGVLDKISSVIANSDEMIRVEGHTDDVPIGPNLKDKFFSNWELSSARAASVVRYLQHGRQIDPARMEAVGHAEFRPVDSNETPEGRQRNRRVELVLTTAR